MAYEDHAYASNDLTRYSKIEEETETSYNMYPPTSKLLLQSFNPKKKLQLASSNENRFTLLDNMIVNTRWI